MFSLLGALGPDKDLTPSHKRSGFWNHGESLEQTWAHFPPDTGSLPPSARFTPTAHPWGMPVALSQRDIWDPPGRKDRGQPCVNTPLCVPPPSRSPHPPPGEMPEDGCHTRDHQGVSYLTKVPEEDGKGLQDDVKKSHSETKQTCWERRGDAVGRPLMPSPSQFSGKIFQYRKQVGIPYPHISQALLVLSSQGDLSQPVSQLFSMAFRFTSMIEP